MKLLSFVKGQASVIFTTTMQYLNDFYNHHGFWFWTIAILLQPAWIAIRAIFKWLPVGWNYIRMIQFKFVEIDIARIHSYSVQPNRIIARVLRVIGISLLNIAVLTCFSQAFIGWFYLHQPFFVWKINASDIRMTFETLPMAVSVGILSSSVSAAFDLLQLSRAINNPDRELERLESRAKKLQPNAAIPSK